MRLARYISALILVAAIAAAQAQTPDRASKENFDDKDWAGQKVLLPPYPKPENLARIYVSPNTTFEFFVDTASVSVTQDDAVRYTLVARSSSGAMNVSYEGIRCRNHEHRPYAFGKFDGTWSQARNAFWIPISNAQANRQHAVLAEEFFCPGRVQVHTAEEAVRMLKQGWRPGG